ncbi:MAG TPA: rhodanese-like domain-containing protein [Patescibacteria group bacterium]|nr:rhodanese-like domain-containing protein [Patescibacteria group bacterium]
MQNFKEITADELKQRLVSQPDTVILDVRQPEEYAERNIPNSILIPLGELPARFSELERFKDREIIVHCKMGGRSAQACQFLNQQGFNATNLKGGITAWK